MKHKELITHLAEAHEMDYEDLENIIVQFGILKFLDELKFFGSVEEMTKVLKDLNKYITLLKNLKYNVMKPFENPGT